MRYMYRTAEACPSQQLPSACWPLGGGPHGGEDPISQAAFNCPEPGTLEYSRLKRDHLADNASATTGAVSTETALGLISRGHHVLLDGSIRSSLDPQAALS